MRYTFTPIDAETASAIAGWRYEGPYAMYDGDPAGSEELLRSEYRYHAARDERGDLVGYCTLGADARVAGYDYADDALDVGLGMRPDLVGRGLGAGFTRAVLDFTTKAFEPDALRVTIAAFNRRARRMCLALGFVEEARFVREASGDEFVVLRRGAR